MTNIEHYEALKKDLNEEAARRIAEVVPAAGDLATKLDVSATREDIAAVRIEMAAVRGEFQSSAKDTMRWMLGFFIPVWAGTWATFIAILLKG